MIKRHRHLFIAAVTGMRDHQVCGDAAVFLPVVCLGKRAQIWDI